MKGMMRRRPAESLTAAGAVAFLIGRALGIEDGETLTALTVALGLVPTAVTFAVEKYRQAKA